MGYDSADMEHIVGKSSFSLQVDVEIAASVYSFVVLQAFQRGHDAVWVKAPQNLVRCGSSFLGR